VTSTYVFSYVFFCYLRSDTPSQSSASTCSLSWLLVSLSCTQGIGGCAAVSMGEGLPSGAGVS